MQKVKSEFPEIEEIRQDLESLKTNVVELGKHVQSKGKSEADRLGDIALERLKDLKRSAADEYHKAEKQVKAKPGQSIAIAFAAGLVASALFRGRH